MVNPAPGRTSIINPFGARGRLWSCRPNAQGQGIHTGIDLMAPRGSGAVAARPGTAWHVFWGKNLGQHQLVVHVDDGTADFYAHMSSRVANGTRVAAGQWVGAISDEGNAVGTHLHFERHRNQTGWTCTVQVDPWPSINWQPPPPPPPPPPRPQAPSNRPLPPIEDDPVTPQDVEAIVNAVWARAPWPGHSDSLASSSAANNLGHASVNSRESRAQVAALASAEAGRYQVATNRYQHLDSRLDRLTQAIEALEKKL